MINLFPTSLSMPLHLWQLLPGANWASLPDLTCVPDWGSPDTVTLCELAKEELSGHLKMHGAVGKGISFASLSCASKRNQTDRDSLENTTPVYKSDWGNLAHNICGLHVQGGRRRICLSQTTSFSTCRWMLVGLHRGKIPKLTIGTLPRSNLPAYAIGNPHPYKRSR